MKERRKTKRASVQLPARWESTSGVHEGFVKDISLGGCFVQSGGRVGVKDPIKVEIQLPTERWIYLWGVVAHRSTDEGFAIRFTVVNDKELEMLNLLMEYVGE